MLAHAPGQIRRGAPPLVGIAIDAVRSPSGSGVIATSHRLEIVPAFDAPIVLAGLAKTG